MHKILPATEVEVNAVGSVMVTLVVVEQPLLSVTVNVYVPATKPVVMPATVYGAVPPAFVMVTSAVPPLQRIAPATEVEVNAVGSVIVTEVVVEQPLLSVTVNV